MIYREALAFKSLSLGLNIVLEVVIEVVNYRKTRLLKLNIFSAFYTDMGAEYKSLLFYSSSRWLSRGNVVNRIYELKSEIAIFLKEEGHQRLAEFYDKLFLIKRSYLVDIFENLNTSDLQLRGKNLNAFDLSEKIESFCKKMYL